MTTVILGVHPCRGFLGRWRPRQNLGLLSVLFFSCVCLCLQPSCVALPIPQGFRNIEREGKKIEPYELNFVLPGQTTKTEFIERIGQPYLMLDDLGVMAYYWKMLSAYVPWIGYGAAGMAEMDRQYLLLVLYDDHDVIEHYEIIRKYQKNEKSIFNQDKTDPRILESITVHELARQWAAKRHRLKNSPCAQQE
jgi:hypothetical protein